MADFLSDNTRKVRKGLLIASLVSFAISKVGLVVNKVSIVGTEFSLTRFEAIPFILSLVVIYYLITFLSYGFHEYSEYHKTARKDYIERLKTGDFYSPTETAKELEARKAELKGLEDEFEKAEHMDLRNTLLGRINSKKEEISTHERIAGFHNRYRPKLLERLKFANFRWLMELYAPLFIGIYTLLVLLLFTEIPTENDKSLKDTKQTTVGKHLPDSSNTEINKDSLSTPQQPKK